MTVSALPTPRPWRHRPSAGKASPVEFHLALHLRKFKREQAILDDHRPGRRRLRIVRFAGFPIPALVLRCRCCGAVWPCRELLGVLRSRIGWTAQVDKLDRALGRIRRGLGLTESW